MQSPWHFGNTTVRNPLRIRDGLNVVNQPSLNGRLNGKDQEILLAHELDKAGVISLQKTEPDFMGRKWRACFSQLGFITHKFNQDLNVDCVDPKILEVINVNPELDLTGRPYQITPSGMRMLLAESVQEQQECMLRALLAYEIPSVIESRNGDLGFKPFYFILQILKSLGEGEQPLGLSMVEMAIVQSFRNHDSVQNVVEMVLKFRAERMAEVGRVGKRRKDRTLLEYLAKQVGLKANTLKDYADVNFRYPRLTGLVSFSGRRIVLSESKIPIINAILADGPKIIGLQDHSAYLTRLWKGADLPTDNEVIVKEEINRFRSLVLDSGVDPVLVPVLPDTTDVAKLNQVRIRLQDIYQQILEKNYALSQRDDDQVRETIAYLKKIDKQEIDTDTYDLEIEDEPAYLEWAVWRAFLAINDLVNQPHEARRFRVDQDFLPLGCAPGNGPDMFFEFEDYFLVVEVTLTSSSRQEAAEGEPVRRHVAKEKAKVVKNKPVYGLFLARSVDNNTAETFRIGVWYNGDEPDFVNIIPINLKQFIRVLEKFLTCRFDTRRFRGLLDSCLIPRNAHAPAWKREIQKVVEQFLV